MVHFGYIISQRLMETKILPSGNLYRFGEGFLFDGLGGLVLATSDICVILALGGITLLICCLVNNCGKDGRVCAKHLKNFRNHNKTVLSEVDYVKDQIKGIICIVIAAAGFSLMTFFVRLSGDLPTMQKAFFRNAFALVIAVGTLVVKRQKFELKKEFRADIFFRCLFGTTGLIANFYAIDRLALADANMLNKLSPFFAILISIPLLKEKPSKTDILATIVAFIGALFIIRPTPGNMDLVPALIALYGGLGAGAAYVFVRRAGKKGASTPVIVTCFSLFSCLLTLPFMIFSYVGMSARQLIMLIFAGLSAAVGQFGITSAYKFAPAKKLSVFDYVQVIFAALWGILFLNETPTAMSIIGYVIIIGVAVIRWQRTYAADRAA